MKYLKTQYGYPTAVCFEGSKSIDCRWNNHFSFCQSDCTGCNILINLYCYDMNNTVVEFILRLQACKSSPTLHSLFRALLDHSFINVMFQNV